jgi:hypothetical protein
LKSPIKVLFKAPPIENADAKCLSKNAKDGSWSNSDCVGERDKNGNFICECKKVGPTTVVEIFGEQEKKFN